MRTSLAVYGVLQLEVTFYACTMAEEVTEFESDSSVCGYHVYQENWTPVIEEYLVCKREERNPQDRYAVAVKKGGNIVGHVPCNISTLCSLFIRRGSTILCVVSGGCRYSRDLPQGGMEITYKYRFLGNGKEIKKVESYITKPVSSSSTFDHSVSSEKPRSDVPLKLIAVTKTSNDSLVAMSETTNNIKTSSLVTVSSNEVQSDHSSSSDAWKSFPSTNNLISTKLNKISSNSVTSFDHSSGSERSGDVLSQVSNHTPLTENTNGNALLLISSMDSTSTEASNCLVPDQSPKKNDKIILFSGKSLVAEILSDDDTCPEQCTSNNALWITFDRHILQMTDKAVLECGEELSDRHIQMAQSIIKKQFPLLGGLRNTLLQEQVVIGCTVNAVQIVHCNKRKHWITVTTKWCQKNKVNVYDTLFNKLDYETKGVVKSCLH